MQGSTPVGTIWGDETIAQQATRTSELYHALEAVTADDDGPITGDGFEHPDVKLAKALLEEMEDKVHSNKVIIAVRDGVAYVESHPPFVQVEIIDHANESE